MVNRDVRAALARGVGASRKVAEAIAAEVAGRRMAGASEASAGGRGSAAGASQAISLELRERAFSVWDSSVHAWQAVPGTFGVMVGSSSCDIRLRGQIFRPGAD